MPDCGVTNITKEQNGVKQLKIKTSSDFV